MYDRNETITKIIDNKPGRELLSVIKEQLKRSKNAKFAIGYFFLSGFSLVKDDFPEINDQSNLPFLKIVMGNETTYPTKEEMSQGYKMRELIKKRMIEEIQREKLTEEQIQKLKTLRYLIANNIIDVRIYVKSRLHAKLYLFITNPEEKYASPGLAIVGSSNFTAEGLTKNKELNILITSREDFLYLDKWFDELWEEAEEFREDLLKIIDTGIEIASSEESTYPEIGEFVDPETLFKYFVYKWFGDRVLNALNRDILYEFQILGVINAVEKINNYNGVILADSVGLGKSFIASAIIEEFINGKHPSWVPNGKIPSVMLILPPSIITQWEELLIKSGNFLSINEKKLIEEHDNDKTYEICDKNNGKIIGRIRFLSLGLFQNMQENELNEIKEEYDLFIIDEAHKYRNRNTNRWKNVRAIQKKADDFPNKIILLTATPLNNSIIDIYNLIRLFIDDTFTQFRIRNVDVKGLFNEYETLKREIKRRDDRDLRAKLKETASNIKRKILDEIMVLRTRKYIMEQFKEDIKVNGKPLVFKDPKPYTLDYGYRKFCTKEYEELMKLINKNLEKIQFEYTKLYGIRFVVFEEQKAIDEKDEEKTSVTPIEVADLFKILLGKRLESGIYAFETTLRRIYEKEKIFYETFKNNLEKIREKDDLKDLIKSAVEQAKIQKELEEVQEEFNVEEENAEEQDKYTWFDRVIETLIEYSESMKKEDKKYKEIDLIKLGLKKILENIKNDLKLMEEIFEKLDKLKEKEKENGKPKTLGKIPKEKDDVIEEIPIYSYGRNDPKLYTLKQIIGNPSYKSEHLEDIPSLNRKKIIIFTQYKDTAYYLYHNLIEWIEKETDLHTWLKDGKDKIKIGLVTGETETTTKINYIKRFAPKANKGDEEVSKFGEIQILISTDSLSEGVNLQDADAVINYDLPWNPMVIVQRVGRVNRIGNDKDICVINYIPSAEIEVIVGILKKLKEKIKDITLIVGKDIKILSQEEEINIETFGERIKDISKLSITDLEQYGISEDFKEFLSPEMPKEQLDEHKLLNIIQSELKYTQRDFEDVMKMNDGPYYTFIEGDDRIISVYEFYRGEYRIMKKVISISKNGEPQEDTPLAFLDLIKQKEKQKEEFSQMIREARKNLKKMEERVEQIKEKLKEDYVPKLTGFLHNLYNALLADRNKAKGIESKYKVVMATLQIIPNHPYARDIKQILIDKNLIETNRDNVIIKDFKGVIETLYEFFREKGLTKIESLKVKVKHLGWYYEL